MQMYAVIHQIIPAFLPTVSAHNVSAMMVVVAMDRITVSFIQLSPLLRSTLPHHVLLLGRILLLATYLLLLQVYLLR